MGVGSPKSVHVEEVGCELQNETRTWPREVASRGNGGWDGAHAHGSGFVLRLCRRPLEAAGIVRV